MVKHPAIARTALWMSLGVWIGSWGFFAFVVSRVAFRVLPGNVAGDLAGMLLSTLHWGGAAMAMVAALAAAALGRRGWLVGLPIFLGLACVVSELWLSPQIAAIRPSTLGAASTEQTARSFGMLHALSLGLFLSILFASCGLLVWHARLDARPR